MLVLESVLTLQPGYKYPPNATSQHEERLWSQYLKCTATAANGILFCLIHYSSPTAAVKSYLGLSHLLPPLKTGSNIKMLGHIFGVADLCSTVVMCLDICIGLCRPLIVPCMWNSMKVFTHTRKRERVRHRHTHTHTLPLDHTAPENVAQFEDLLNI